MSSMESDFKVKTEVFEGPLDLLLSLIEKRKLFVGDIALAKVADDYLEYIRNLPALPVADTAQFILVASTLVLIKSRSLIPELSLTNEEQQSIEELEMRLALYQRIKDLSGTVKSRWGKNPLFTKDPSPRVPVFAPDKDTTPEGILAALRRVVVALPKPEKLPETVVKKVKSLEEVINDLTDRVTKNLNMTFREFTGTSAERAEIAVHFLAMLELVKTGIIGVTQDRLFGDISMESGTVDVPKY